VYYVLCCCSLRFIPDPPNINFYALSLLDALPILARFFRVEPDRIIVLHDDLDLPFGSLKLKQGGGHGGHNGLRDTTKALSTPERSEEHTSELQSRENLVCRLLLEKKKPDTVEQ